MNASTAALEKRISDLENKMADTPEARAAQRAANEEAVYLARLDRNLNRIRRDIKNGLASHLRSRIKAETEQAEYQLAILHRQNRKEQRQQAVDALGRLPHSLATEILAPRFPEPSVFWMNTATVGQVIAAKQRKDHLEQHRQDHLEQAIAELFEAVGSN